MITGAYVSGNKLYNVTGKIQGKHFEILRTGLIQTDQFKEKGASYAFPLNEFFLKTVILPNILKKDMEKTIKLQLSFHLPYDANNAFTRSQIKKSSKANMLFILSHPAINLIKPAAILPAPVGLYALVLNSYGIPLNQNILIVFQDDNEVLVLAVENQEIVFIRSFSQDESYITNIRLSAQRVYFSDEHKILKIDKVILISQKSEKSGILSKLFDCEVEHILPSVLVEAKNDIKLNKEILFAAGIAVAGVMIKKLKWWNVLTKEDSIKKGIRRGFVYSAPLWILFLIFYFLGEVRSFERMKSGIKGEIKALAPRYRYVMDLEESTGKMQRFMDFAGKQLLTPNKWLTILNTLSDRPYDLSLDIISGKLDQNILIDGHAKTYDLVTDYIKRLVKSNLFKDINLIFTQGTAEKGITFQLSFKLADDK